MMYGVTAGLPMGLGRVGSVMCAHTRSLVFAALFSQELSLFLRLLLYLRGSLQYAYSLSSLSALSC